MFRKRILQFELFVEEFVEATEIAHHEPRESKREGGNHQPMDGGK